MAAHQAPPSLGFSRQEHWSRLPFPSLGHLPDSGINIASPALAGRFFATEPPREAHDKRYVPNNRKYPQKEKYFYIFQAKWISYLLIPEKKSFDFIQSVSKLCCCCFCYVTSVVSNSLRPHRLTEVFQDRKFLWVCNNNILRKSRTLESMHCCCC